MGTVEFQGIGVDHFRMDTITSLGKQTTLVKQVQHKAGTSNFNVSKVSLLNSLKQNSYLMPWLVLYQAVSDQSMSVQDMGIKNDGGAPLHCIRVHVLSNMHVPGIDDGNNWIDYSFNGNNFTLVRISYDAVNDVNPGQKIPYELNYSGFKLQEGIPVPIQITEKIGGQVTYKVQINSFTLNPGLSEQQFEM